MPDRTVLVPEGHGCYIFPLTPATNAVVDMLDEGEDG